MHRDGSNGIYFERNENISMFCEYRPYLILVGGLARYEISFFCSSRAEQSQEVTTNTILSVQVSKIQYEIIRDGKQCI